MTWTVKMATSFHSKLSELEARLKAENEAKKRDCLAKDLTFEGQNFARTRPCMYNARSAQICSQIPG